MGPSQNTLPPIFFIVYCFTPSPTPLYLPLPYPSFVLFFFNLSSPTRLSHLYLSIVYSCFWVISTKPLNHMKRLFLNCVSIQPFLVLFRLLTSLHPLLYRQNISEDIQKMPQSRNTALPRHQRKERWGTNKDTTNVTYEITNAHIPKTRQFKYIENLTSKNWKCSDKKKNWYFHISAQNIDCGGSNEYEQSMFWAKK